MAEALEIRDLCVAVAGKEILRKFSLTIRPGEVHALMGPNGSGKSTLAYTLMGHPGYKVTCGEVWYKGQNILNLPPDERSQMGIFLAFQYPVSIPGVSVANFLRTALNARRRARGEGDGNGQTSKPKSISIPEFRKLMREKMKLLQIDESFAGRYVNEGFSGGEKKRVEILQMAMLQPEMAILDETDSGLDIDALRQVSEGINRLMGPHMGVLLITHYQRLLDYIKPHFVHVLLSGRVVESGGPDFAKELEVRGYDWIRAKYGEPLKDEE